jgi:CubicO group peptidase (beta-lactamase class C family)
MTKKIYLLVVIALALIAILLLWPGKRAGEDIELTAALDTLFADMKADDPGGSFLIMKDGKELWSASYGLADIETGEEFSRKTVANIGSISKTFVAYGILILHQQGRLSLDDRISSYFPDFTNMEIAEKVRIIHLITHTSGLPDSRNVSEALDFYLTADDKQNFAPLKLTDTLEFEPGSNWNYSNPSYNGLALIIEQVTGTKWQEFVSESIFKPAGMKTSTITDGSWPDSGVAHGYRLVDKVWEEYDYGEYPTFNAAGNGGIWSSVDELIKYVEAMNECKFIDCETIALSKRVWEFPNWKASEPSTQGLCWVVNNSSDTDKSLCIKHTGSQGGFRAHLMMYPDENIVVAWITNNSRTYSDQIRKVLNDHGYIKDVRNSEFGD